MKQTTPQLAAAKVLAQSPLRPKLGIILGTGFECGRALEADAKVPYKKIPGFPPTRVTGHAGELVIGRLAGVPVILLRGRAHFYEGHSMSSITFGVRVLAACGIRDLLLTNAAGGISSKLKPGDFMVIEDHINFMGTNPLRGVKVADEHRFVDLSQVYEPRLTTLLFQAARACRLKLKKGVYLAVSGPSYETPAEITAFRRLGADAVGMSTVPEAIVARQCGLAVAAISCITNAAAGLGNKPLAHREVLETTSRLRVSAERLLEHFARLYGAGW